MIVLDSPKASSAFPSRHIVCNGAFHSVSMCTDLLSNTPLQVLLPPQQHTSLVMGFEYGMQPCSPLCTCDHQRLGLQMAGPSLVCELIYGP